MMENQKPIYDCAGNLVVIKKGEKYKKRCAYGNLEDYAKDHREFVIKDISEPKILPQKPVQINIIIPVYNSGAGVLPTIESVLKSEFENNLKIELSFIINCPEHMSDLECKKNKKTLKLLGFIFENKKCSIKEFCPKVRELKRLFEKRKSVFQVLIINKKTKNGLGEIYQKGVTSYLVKLYNYAKNQLENGQEKNNLIPVIEQIETDSVLLFLDDDILLEVQDIQNMYNACIQKDSIAIGQMDIVKVHSENKDLEEVLKIIMQSWLDFKRAFDMNTLPPKMAKFKTLHHTEDVSIDEDYADQQFFARMRNAVKNVYEIDIKTTISERDYPCNGGFMKQLRLYLEARKKVKFEDLDFLQNILKVYKTRGGNKIYKLESVIEFFKLVQERNMIEIIKKGNELKNQIKQD